MQDNYEPYGPEWVQQMKMLTKAEMISMFKRVATKESKESEQFTRIIEWQKETFKTANSVSKLWHLLQEVRELRQAFNEFDERAIRMEFADCFILLMGAAASAGLSHADILNCIEEKMIINKSRNWGTPDANGVVNHIEENPKDEA